VLAFVQTPLVNLLFVRLSLVMDLLMELLTKQLLVTVVDLLTVTTVMWIVLLIDELIPIQVEELQLVVRSNYLR
jgi:hypothetical protein